MPNKLAVSATLVNRKIFSIRGRNVMLSPHLAELYQVEARALNQAVKRNSDRFPPDFMFQLTREEFENLKSHFVTSSWGGIRRAMPYAFTQEGVAMLSSVLQSKRAVQVNIAIMRAFVQLRNFIENYKGLADKIAAVEKKYNAQFRAVFQAIEELVEAPAEEPDPKRRIGFYTEDK